AVIDLDAVADHRAVAVLASGGQEVDRALEAVEGAHLAFDDDVERLVVLVATDLAALHRCGLLSLVRAARCSLNQSTDSRATSSSAPAPSNRCVAPATTSSRHQPSMTTHARRLRSTTTSSRSPTMRSVGTSTCAR